ncbi:MAG: [Fe-Fe] hydrogenase large subunit C-terminal domain-containing protein [Clostridium sp.]|uniref:[Fe-Fe] hydrogenase large subunit C-terminal domain-containing protein n=1 Tax=Clostridium culturomicium TaxID=1499683 RepID=UPI00059104C0|nr:[Fe-Fe] hydrogenase large subunit C-terminal domain-containing protein [Clostridium culturomicium]MDU4891858.1 [Fe-Fe] hydrogenase large subunit C-terminal domain-containing protein [Clostridium sp.]MDU7084807.1 [Fe-Fe] hydrogenase large subunit C-terminal domain-containing protein [Clostridium sp.]
MQVMDFSSANCKNCYKCVRTCTVKAIKVLNDQAKIEENKCISCGHCLVVCPQNARHVLSDIDSVKQAINENKTIVAQLAPAYKGVFEHPEKLISALRTLGFSYIEEVSIGAELVSQKYEEIISNSNSEQFITSCCPSVVMLIEKYYPELIPIILPVSSPMIAHGKTIKNRYDNPFTVFIGPCISKKCEALSEDNKGIIDAVLTFDEIKELLNEKDISYCNLENDKADYEGTQRGSQYPLVGGILNALKPTLEKKDIDIISIHGLENCINILEELKSGNLKGVCVELSACNESCLGGPGVIHNKESIYTRLKRLKNYIKNDNSAKNLLNINVDELNLQRNYKNKKTPMLIPTNEELTDILRAMGKYTKDDELNCGGCGYNTCRDKSVAVYNGMSQVEMCIPYMRSLAESMNNEIFSNSTNAIIFVNKNLEIRNINPSGVTMFLRNNPRNIEGTLITDLLNDDDFKRVFETKNNVVRQKVYYEDLNFYGYKSIVHIPNDDSLLVTFTDITDEENRKLELTQVKTHALDVTQTIINKQMRVAQEIASLLGETTAETKVAILELKKVLEKEI